MAALLRHADHRSHRGAEPLDGTERPRGRRRRPGPADTGSFPFPVSEAEALREQPRGRRRRPESDESARWAPESDPLFDGRGHSPQGRGRQNATTSRPTL